MWLSVLCTHFFGARGEFDDRKLSGTFFKPETGYVNDNDNSISMMFEKVYHRCGAMQDCNFVVLHMKDGSYKTISRMADLPKDKQNYKVWRKMPEGNSYIHAHTYTYIHT